MSIVHELGIETGRIDACKHNLEQLIAVLSAEQSNATDGTYDLKNADSTPVTWGSKTSGQNDGGISHILKVMQETLEHVDSVHTHSELSFILEAFKKLGFNPAS